MRWRFRTLERSCSEHSCQDSGDKTHLVNGLSGRLSVFTAGAMPFFQLHELHSRKVAVSQAVRWGLFSAPFRAHPSLSAGRHPAFSVAFGVSLLSGVCAIYVHP